jgi:hypothetical protein
MKWAYATGCEGSENPLIPLFTPVLGLSGGDVLPPRTGDR